MMLVDDDDRGCGTKETTTIATAVFQQQYKEESRLFISKDATNLTTIDAITSSLTMIPAITSTTTNTTTKTTMTMKQAAAVAIVIVASRARTHTG